MSKEVSRSISDLPIKNRWDGGVKYYTNECPRCDSYEELSDGEVCFGGVAWKQLTREKVQNACSLKRRVSGEKGAASVPKHPVIVYTPLFRDFVDGTLDWLELMGFRATLVRKRIFDVFENLLLCKYFCFGPVSTTSNFS